jgi:hypothetical protein
MAPIASIAFKEWAAVCRAIGDGSQSIILRKGGIAETDGEFRPEYDRFFLFPTYFHERERTGLKQSAQAFAETAERDRPPEETIRIQLAVEVATVRHVTDLSAIRALDSFHVWSADEIERRFNYRTPGLYVLIVRCLRLPATIDLPNLADYAGCKSWVPLAANLDWAGAVPVLDEPAFLNAQRAILAALGRH